MAFFRKAAGLLRQTASKHINQEIAGAKPSIFQAIRCMSSSKVFVGGLSYNTDDMGLRETFSKYGVVADAKVIQDRETGRSRGFGFVTYDTPDAASAAIQALDGQQLDGRTVRVNYANDRQGFRGGGGRYGGQDGYGGGQFGGQGGYGGGQYVGQGGYGGGQYGGQDGYGGGQYGGQDGYGRGSGDSYGNYATTGGDGYASGGNYQSGYNAGGPGGNYASGGYGYNNAVGVGNDVGEGNNSAGNSFSSGNYNNTEGLAGADPVGGDFRDDDEPSDYADKRA